MLVGFGLDSFVESFSSGIMIWRFKHRRNMTKKMEEEIEKKAFRYVGITFLILGLYVLVDSIISLIYEKEPVIALWTIVIPVFSILIMTGVYLIKKNIVKSTGSKSLALDAKQTLVCILMSFVLLTGLYLNVFWDLWWVDGVCGIIISLFLFKEGYEALFEEKACC
jgi:divalent metal cation (Fe/Co/Zn/Cd) transporter